MNKLLFKLQRDFNDDITLVCNNVLDLEQYLTQNYDWHSFRIYKETISITEREGFNNEIATIEWIKEI